MSEPKTKLVDLVQGYLNDALTQEEFSRLEELILVDNSAADIFTHAVETDHMLHELLGKEGAESQAASLALSSLGISGLSTTLKELDREKKPPRQKSGADAESCQAIDPASSPGDSNLGRANISPRIAEGFSFTSPSFLLGSCLAVASVFLAFAIILEWTPDESELAQDQFDANSLDEKAVHVARLTRVWKPKWVEPSQGVRDWGELKIGQVLELESGKAEVFYSTGAQLILEAPFRFEVIGPNQGKVFHGKVVTRVSEEARGFSLLTAVGNVIDYGTEFGLNVSADGGADLVVFDGEIGFDYSVPLATPGGIQSPQNVAELRLVAGQGARIGLDGSTERIVSIDSNHFPRAALDVSPSSSQTRVISGITDNFRTSGAGPFYEIVHNGLREDSQAYVDRPYEWNGMTLSGMPSFLIGADYIKTFNDDKFRESFEVTVELERPANLYLFWDDRMAVPDWLKEEFADTGHDIGLDEVGGAPNGFRDSKLGVGAGAQVDYPFSIWTRHVASAEKVKLQYRLRRHTVGMFGIAAVASEQSNEAFLDKQGKEEN